MMHRIGRTFAMILVILLFFSAFLPASLSNSNASEAEKVRVGVIATTNLFEYSTAGPIGGYGYEILQTIAEQTGWQYSYVYVTEKNAYPLLESGSIDLILPATKLTNLADRFLYSSNEAGLDYGMLCVRIESKQYAQNDFRAFTGMTVGAIKGTNLNDPLYEFTQLHDFSVNISWYDDLAKMRKALKDGEVDAILIHGTEMRQEERVIARFSPTPFYLIGAKTQPELMQELDAAMNAIKEADPFYQMDLQKTYYESADLSVPVYTEAEKEYIKNHEPLLTVYDPAWKPIEYRDENSGEFSGITSEFFRLLSKNTGLQFSYMETDSYADSLATVTEGQATILCGIDNDVHWANQHHLWLSEPYLSASIVLVKNDKVKDLDTATAALSKDFLAATEYVKRYNPNMPIVYFNTPKECFAAVNRGDAQITYANSYVAEQLLSDPKLNKLSIVETVNLADHLCIGVSKEEDPILISILNKGIASISDNQMNEIIFRHTLNTEPQITLEYLLYKDPQYLITSISLIFMIIIFIMAYVIRMKNNHTKTVESIAYTDSVTGTANYTKFKMDAEMILKNFRGKSYAIVYLDIYKFSYINDTLGYQAGDAILAEVAALLQENLNYPELSARISADNFVCLVEYQNDLNIIKRHDRFQALCDERLHGKDERLKVNFVSSVYRIKENEKDIAALVGKADIAHKTIGDLHESTVVFYDDRIHQRYLREKELENAMAPAIEQDEFLFYLQPKYELETKEIVGAEALVRWLRAGRDLVMPDQFIELFESNGFILKMDFFIYEKVMKRMAEWINRGVPVVPISVNVSKLHVSNPRFAYEFDALVKRYGIPQRLVELELTESIFFSNEEEALKVIQQLKSYGYSISIDDFGSGYSSLNLLKDMPVDYLKLDKEFFRKVGMAAQDKIILRGIISIAKELQLKIVSEGVETKDQIDFLERAGCHIAQGYYFAKPMPTEEFEKLLQETTK